MAEVTHSLNDFLNMVHQKPLNKPTMFLVEFPDFDNGEELSLLCHSTHIPGYTIMSNPLKMYGLPVERPYEIAFDPARITFYVDQDHALPYRLYAKRDEVIDPVSYSPKYAHGADGKRGYVMPSITIYILKYDVVGETTSTYEHFNNGPKYECVQIASYVLHNAWIKGVNSMPLSWNAVNQIQEVTVDIQYEYMSQESQGATSGEQEDGLSGNTSSEADNIAEAQGDPTMSPAEDYPSDMVEYRPQPWGSSDSQSDNMESDASTYTDSSAMNEAFTSQGGAWDMQPKSNSFTNPVLMPVDNSNVINDVAINPTGGNVMDGKQFSSQKLPANYDTIKALSPSKASGFLSSLKGSNPMSGVNSALSGIKAMQRNISGTIGDVTRPLTQIQNTVSNFKSTIGQVSRAVKNLPATAKSQVNATVNVFKVPSKGGTGAPGTRQKSKP